MNVHQRLKVQKVESECEAFMSQRFGKRSKKISSKNCFLFSEPIDFREHFDLFDDKFLVVSEVEALFNRCILGRARYKLNGCDPVIAKV